MAPTKESSLTFCYKLPPELRSKSNISKEQEKYYPFIPIILYNMSKTTPVIEAIIDSGADYIHIPRVLAENLELKEGKKGKSSGMGGEYNTFETEVGLKIGRGIKTIDIGYVRAFYPETDTNVPIIIGRHPVFENFKIIFEEYDKKFTLILNTESGKKKGSVGDNLKKARKPDKGKKFQR